MPSQPRSRRTGHRIPALTIATLLAVLFATSAHATDPRLIPFQGKLTNADGSPVPDGNVNILFSIYDVPSGGTAKWSELEQNVVIQGGQINLLLGGSGTQGPSAQKTLDDPNGDGNAADGLDFTTTTYFLGVKVGGQAAQEMAPRQQLVPSFHARSADQAKIATTVANNVVTTASIQTGAVTTASIGDGQVKSADIGDGEVTSTKLAAGSVTTSAIADGTVTGTDIADGTIATADIADGAVTLAKTNFAFGTNATNTRLGSLALNGITTGGTNTGIGASALKSNTTGDDNTAVGESALRDNTTGKRSTALGERSLIFSNGDQNTAVGWGALNGNISGTNNTAIGVTALVVNNNGTNNTAAGFFALGANTSGGSNVAVGNNALVANTSGSSNIAIGSGAGSNLTTGSNNIIIGNAGLAGDANAIRIGNSGNASATNVTIQGIFGGGVNGSGVNVMIDNSGKTGVGFSSIRFKENVHDMGDSSNGLLKLRPVTYRYKPDFDPTGLPQYGLIAEEVAKVYPDLVLWKDGKPLTVRYQFLVPMLLNEFQKQHKQQTEQADELRALRSQVTKVTDIQRENATLTQENAELRARLGKIEQAVAQLMGQDGQALHIAAVGR